MPAPNPASWSSTTKAKLLVPSGGFDHDSCGETFSPLQFGPRAGMSPTFLASMSPSLKEADERLKTSAARARAPGAQNARAAASGRTLATVMARLLTGCRIRDRFGRAARIVKP